MRLQAFCIILIAALVAGCSGITVSQDYDRNADFGALSSYSWKVHPDDQQYDDSEISPLVATRVRNAIKNEFAAKGIIYSETAPDFLVDYNLKVESRISSTNVGTTIGYGAAGYGHYGGLVFSTAPDIRQYDEGTLFIDFYTADDKRLVWRGISSQIIDKHDSPDRVTKQVNLSVQKILEQFPPKSTDAR
jgi:hypothetical protein